MMATGDRHSKGKPVDVVVHIATIDEGEVLCDRKNWRVKTDMSEGQGLPTCKICIRRYELQTTVKIPTTSASLSIEKNIKRNT